MRFHIGPKTTVRITLGRLHLSQPAFVTLQHLGLIGNGDLSVHDDGKVKPHEIAENARKSGVRQLLKAYERIEQPSDVDIGIGLIEDADIGQLFPGAAVLNQFFARSVAAGVGFERIERALRL